MSIIINEDKELNYENIKYFYDKQINIARAERKELFWLLTGRNLTIGLFKMVAENKSEDVPFDLILKFLSLEPRNLHTLISEVEPSIPEFFSLKLLSYNTFEKVLDENLLLFAIKDFIRWKED